MMRRRIAKHDRMRGLAEELAREKHPEARIVRAYRYDDHYIVEAWLPDEGHARLYRFDPQEVRG